MSSSSENEDVFVFPSSFQQEQLWLHHQMEPGDASYNVPLTFRLDGELDVAALERALALMVERHEVLRTSFAFVDGSPAQLVQAQATCEIRIEETSTPEERAKEEVGQPFDLSRGPLFRTLLLRMSDTEHWLVVTFHHIVVDGWSLAIFAKELAEFYNELCAGGTPDAGELPIQFADFAIWQRETLQGEEFEDHLRYWTEKLDGVLPALDLPTDRPRPPVQSHRGDAYLVSFDEELVDGLKAFSRREGVTLFMTILGAFNVLLARYTRQTDLLVGSPVANRNNEEIENSIGFFVNTIVLRNDLSGNPSFREFLQRVRGVVSDAFEHQEVPFERIVEGMIGRDFARAPVFQTMFTLQTVPPANFGLHGLKVHPVQVATGTSKFDLLVELTESSAGIDGFIEYSTDLFDEPTIRDMARHFEVLLRAIVEDPDTTIDALPLMSAEERHRVVVEWNHSEAEYPRDVPFHRLVENQVERTPEAVAVVFEKRHLSYRDLDERANRIAHQLRELGVQTGSIVGICLERSADMLAALIGVLKAGAAYLPLDPDYPTERLSFMIEDSGLEVVVTEDAFCALLPDAGLTLFRLDGQSSQLAAQPSTRARVDVGPEDLAYVIYTSGSTGKPKGVMVPHRAVANFLTSMSREPGITAEDSLLAITTLNFDISVLELFAPLIVGARVVVASRDVTADGHRLLELLRESGATIMQATPAGWRMLVQAGWLGADDLKVLCGGEALPGDLAAQLLERSVSLWNMYGPTETTVWSSCFEVRDAERRLIGRPIANTQIYLLDRLGQPVPAGVPGEVYIGGDGVTRGYLKRPELTAGSFVADPFVSAGDAILYRTGDLARYLPDGNIEYFNRLDSQLKVRGFRIEPGEIESVLMENDAVSQAVVIVRELRPGDQRLLVYYTLEHGQDATVSQLRRHLKARLPEYMVPSLLVALDALPLTENGKIKRGALPDPFGADLSRGSDGFAPPESEMEELLASAWQDALGVERVGREDNFFEIGGHSLLAIQVISVIEDKTGVRLSPRQLGLEGLSSLAASCQSAVGPDMGERETGSKSGGLVSRLVAILRPSRRSTTN